AGPLGDRARRAATHPPRQQVRREDDLHLRRRGQMACRKRRAQHRLYVPRDRVYL
uniref:hypothetical protein n=1 Tax=Faecalibacterium sp. TaxID=1971605 RepID=UPI003FEF4DAA